MPECELSGPPALPSNSATPSKVVEDLVKNGIGLAVILAVFTAVIVLILRGGLAPVIAVATVGAAGVVGTRIYRRLVGLPATRFGAAVEAGMKSFLGALALNATDHAIASPATPAAAGAARRKGPACD